MEISHFQQLLEEVYNANSGRIPKMEMMMLWFPTYLKHYHFLMQEIFYGDGPLCIEERHFLAILAVNAYGCDYLFLRLKSSFLEYGGVIFKFINL